MLSIVLSRRDFRESDQIISLFTKDQGKLELLARGVKKITSKNSAHLEPFSLVQVSIEKGKEIDHLTTVQSVEFFSDIRKNIDKSLATGYLVSLVDKLTQVGEREGRIFEMLVSWLRFVEGASSFNSALVDGYIVKLLHCLGFSPELKRCVVCGVEEVVGLYPAGGGVICQACWKKKEKLGEQVLDCNLEQAKNLNIFLVGDWHAINNAKCIPEGHPSAGKMQNAKLVHDLIYKYMIFHSEKKLPDFGMFDKISH
ncbi:DNA repair protein RecO [Patescibacteria group bacterium]|nr:DNA repair protein RecO [Patescibacteria group bacterium]MBU1895798.1 DNA repair protein RecO [Patescibacteria group bacterium]